MNDTTKQSANPAEDLEFDQSQATPARSAGAQIFLAGWFAGVLIVLASIWQLDVLGFLSLHLQSVWPASLLASAVTSALRLYLDQSPTLDLLPGLALVPASVAAAGLAVTSLAAAPARWNRRNAR
jgi:hypothetical protein